MQMTQFHDAYIFIRYQHSQSFEFIGESSSVITNPGTTTYISRSLANINYIIYFSCFLIHIR